MDAWDPQLVAAVAHQLALPDAPRDSSLRAFLELYHSFAITSRFLRVKPLGECMTALQELVEARKDVPAPVHRCLAISAPPNEALACAVTVASALFAGDITEALVGRSPTRDEDIRRMSDPLVARVKQAARGGADSVSGSFPVRYHSRGAKIVSQSDGSVPAGPIDPDAVMRMVTKCAEVEDFGLSPEELNKICPPDGSAPVALSDPDAPIAYRTKYEQVEHLLPPSVPIVPAASITARRVLH